MTYKFHHRGIIFALLGLALCVIGSSGVGSAWSQPPGNRGLMNLTPYPPAQCQPLVLGQPCVPAPQAVALPAIGCAPPAVAPPLRPPEPSLVVGYLGKDRGTQVTFNYSGAPNRVVRTTKAYVDLQGIWAECAFPIVLTYKEEFTVSVGHLFPFRTEAAQTYGLFEPVDTRREWRPGIGWWDVTTSWTRRLGNHWTGIVGFRWSSFSIRFDHPRDQQGFVGYDDSARLNCNMYIPLVGLLWENNSPRIGYLKASVIGSPFLPGNFEHTEWLNLAGQRVEAEFPPGGEYKTGYFIEATGEYLVCRGAWHYGGFVRCSAAHTERERHVQVNAVPCEDNILFDRSYWVVGGKIGFSL